MTKKLTDFNLNPVTTAKGKRYTPTVQYPPGMEQLVQIVAQQQKDIKRLNKCLTKAGADEWINKYHSGKGWEAYDADITGPDGKPDGYNEVFIVDKQGNVKVINGYKLTKTDYPIRKSYYENVPRWTREELDNYRDKNGNPFNASTKRFKLNSPKNSFKQFKNAISRKYPKIGEDGKPTGEWTQWDGVSGAVIDDYRKLHPITPKRMFTELIKGVWDDYKEHIPDEQKLDAYRIWSHGEYIAKIVKPALHKIGKDYDSIPYLEDLNIETKTKKFKEAALEFLYKIYTDPEHYDDGISINQNGEYIIYSFNDDIQNDLQELVGRGLDEDTQEHLFGQMKEHITPEAKRTRKQQRQQQRQTARRKRQTFNEYLDPNDNQIPGNLFGEATMQQPIPTVVNFPEEDNDY